jgi:hypothetical protein
LPNITTGSCASETNVRSFGMVNGILDVGIDAAILLIALRLIGFVALPSTQKVLMVFVLGAGLLTVIAGAIRLYYTAITLYAQNVDQLWEGYMVYMFLIIELDVGVICASLPACKTLFQAMFEKSQKETSPALAQLEL